jgi:hypothetical protein
VGFWIAFWAMCFGLFDIILISVCVCVWYTNWVCGSIWAFFFFFFLSWILKILSMLLLNCGLVIVWLFSSYHVRRGGLICSEMNICLFPTGSTPYAIWRVIVYASARHAAVALAVRGLLISPARQSLAKGPINHLRYYLSSHKRGRVLFGRLPDFNCGSTPKRLAGLKFPRTESRATKILTRLTASTQAL